MIFGSIKIPLVQKDNSLIYYQNGKIYEMSDTVNQEIVTLKLPLWVKLSSRSRLLTRLFRCIPRGSCIAQEKYLIFSFLKRIFIINLKNRKIKKKYSVRAGFSNPLNIVPLTQTEHYIALFGDYGSNNKKESIYIYGIAKDLSCDILYRFPENTIRHVHNIIPDPDNQSFIILTGDVGKHSGIYRLDESFQICDAIVSGKQKYRAVQGFFRGHFLIYATDAVMEENGIFEINLNTTESRCYGPINGSCIYGTKCMNDIFISTCVEADETVKGKFRKYLTYKLGNGIKNRNVTILRIKDDNEIEEIATYKKDVWPMKLFQYGTVLFPQVYGDNDYLYYMPVGVRRSDLKLKKYILQERA